MKSRNYIFLLCVLFFLFISSCKKLVTIDPPINTVTTQEVFKDSINAQAAFGGLYSSMIPTTLYCMDGALSIISGESADELVPFASSGDLMYNNAIISSNAGPSSYFWIPTYQYIYKANSILGGVQASTGISSTAKAGFLAEAKFLRALYYFYLINLFGNVPYLTSIDFNITKLTFRTPITQVYGQITSDLKEAESVLPSDYSNYGNDRIRSTRWAAAALLARVYLYNDKWDSAEMESTSVINNSGLFTLDSDLTKVFLKKSLGNNEAILQWQLNTQTGTATAEGRTLIPNNAPNNKPSYYLSQQLLAAFEPGDKRKVAWVNSTQYGTPSITYYFPYKYKIGQVQSVPGGASSEYTTVLRLAEQYLIRAEARAWQNNVDGAIADLNVVRARAGLTPIANGLTQSQVLAAVTRENRIEFFAEWGHRWLDLKRTGQVDSVMNIATPLKGQGTLWKSYQQLYPIPLSELQNDPNLTQNPGY